MNNKALAILVFGALLLVACGAGAETPRELTVMTHDSFAVSEDVVAQFESQHNVDVVFLKLGDTGEAVNKAVLAAGNPLADVFYGVDNTFLSRALEGGIFEAYESSQLDGVADFYKLDPESRALPINYGDVCVNYDIAFLDEARVSPPANIQQLTGEEYRDLLAVQNPATSSPGLSFLLATIGAFGEDGYLDYWAALRDNGLKVVNDWESAYYTEFSRWGGSYPMVISYASSPPVEVLFAEEPLDEAPTAAVTGPASCFRQIEFAGILRGTQQRELAETWIDFMLSPAFQEDLPLQMFVFPVLNGVELPPIFEAHARLADEPVLVNFADIAEKREDWIAAWTEVVLR